ncbi:MULTISPECIES: hypothetical protein [Neisseria]|uniref:hypothetical protein n=1 Tax=Neisseria TaxID=482 RepID=UPI00211C4BDF|nr:MULTISPECIES: hypothetical protein [Neisseria]MCQ9325436.1 hypothetical protein [Neisseria dentiae]MDO4228142.1 hypothetical protein [Neisseria sp.]
MSRKPYTAKQPANWYMQNRFFKLYMLRELTSVPVAFAALNLFCGLASLAGSFDAWAGWVEMQTSPLVVLFNLLAVAAACFNSKTWFEAVPKAMPIQKGEKFVPAAVLVKASWGAFAAVFVVLVLLVAVLA